MKEAFYTKHDQHEFKELFDAIHFYYPIELSMSLEEHQNYPGTVKMGDLINENFIKQRIYRDKWVTFRKHLKSQLNCNIVETMVAFYPCYSGSMIIKKENFGQYITIKKLDFYISLLGPYYSIIGVDESIIKLGIDGTFANAKIDLLDYPAIHALTVSPFLEFEKDFLALEKEIKEYFPGIRIIPYRIFTTEIGRISFLEPFEQRVEKDTIFNALFNPDLKFHSPTRGNEKYGFDDWLITKKLGPLRIQEIKDRLTSKSEKNRDGISVHKLWKLKEVILLPNPTTPSLTMQKISAIDFTDSDTVLVVTEENEEPFTSPYQIVSDSIHINSFEKRITLKISALSESHLVLILSLNIEKSGHHFTGDVAQMIFELYS